MYKKMPEPGSGIYHPEIRIIAVVLILFVAIDLPEQS